jgi:hypothetical protein
VFLIGQVMGTIEFAKSLRAASLNQLKFDKMIVAYRPFNAQFSLVNHQNHKIIIARTKKKKEAILMRLFLD